MTEEIQASESEDEKTKMEAQAGKLASFLLQLSAKQLEGAHLTESLLSHITGAHQF